MSKQERKAIKELRNKKKNKRGYNTELCNRDTRANFYNQSKG